MTPGDTRQETDGGRDVGQEGEMVEMVDGITVDGAIGLCWHVVASWSLMIAPHAHVWSSLILIAVGLAILWQGLPHAMV